MIKRYGKELGLKNGIHIVRNNQLQIHMSINMKNMVCLLMNLMNIINLEQ